jgi:hypothetical protein
MRKLVMIAAGPLTILQDLDVKKEQRVSDRLRRRL